VLNSLIFCVIGLAMASGTLRVVQSVLARTLASDRC